jgi:hypothetical protein
MARRSLDNLFRLNPEQGANSIPMNRREQISQIKSYLRYINIESSSDFSGELFYLDQLIQ